MLVVKRRFLKAFQDFRCLTCHLLLGRICCWIALFTFENLKQWRHPRKNRTTANWTHCRVNFPQCARDADRQANGPTGKELGPAPKMYLSSSCRFFFSCSGIKLTCFDWWIMSKDCPVCSVWNTSFYLCVLEHSVLSSEHFFGKSVLEVTAKHKSFRVQSGSSPTQQGPHHGIQLGAVASY